MTKFFTKNNVIINTFSRIFSKKRYTETHKLDFEKLDAQTPEMDAWVPWVPKCKDKGDTSNFDRCDDDDDDEPYVDDGTGWDNEF